MQSPAEWDALTAALLAATLHDIELTWVFLCSRALVEDTPAARARFRELATEHSDAHRVAEVLRAEGVTTEFSRTADPDGGAAIPAFEQFDVLGKLRRLEAFFAKERELSGSSDWNAFSRAKGNHRWIRNYLGLATEVARTHDRTYGEQLLSLIPKAFVDSDYDEPEWAQARVRQALLEFIESAE